MVFRFSASLLVVQFFLIGGASASMCIDSDGDGYGWDGTATCIPENSGGTTEPGQCIDSDGDGYGWNGTATCVPVYAPPVSNIPAAQCIDSDGDGYGWDGIQTCLVSVGSNEETSTSQCIDEDGDGFGWNGVATCTQNSSSLIGVVSVGAFTSIDANGALLAYPADISAFFTESAEWIEEFFTTGRDQCRVTVERFNPEDSSYDTEVFATDNFPGLPVGPLNYSAVGETLTVTGSDGFSSDLSEGVGGGYFLAENSDLATTGLQISIPPSARFAAFTDVGIPDVVPVDRPGLDPKNRDRHCN